ncbi:hypothetical protein DCC85_00850 [Paenibacillus sp. CAA11]|uniref:ABC transporter permease n=1 Tax=Paenibacillus sp. CAA11 TaxID=1532905 RepID=UPI000D3A6142|nr:ABC transporter permease [Paenibacillus sp. CAA11]AWB42916.1 hypothetical protein DCC85_00850 [Paenibacillus sp. CAA11]
MSTYFKVLSSERLKMSKSHLWLLILGSPALAMLIGLLDGADIKNNWYSLLITQLTFHSMLFLPVLTGLFSSFICRYEHMNGGWKALVALPVSRTAVYLAKFTIVAVMLGITQLLMLAPILAASYFQHFTAPIPWGLLAETLIGGWIACLPLAALQMFASLRWASFAGPLVVNIIFTIPNILVAQSATYGPYYPWAQPFLTMIPKGGPGYDFGAFNLSFETLMFTVVGSFILFFAAGLIYFNRKEI